MHNGLVSVHRARVIGLATFGVFALAAAPALAVEDNSPAFPNGTDIGAMLGANRFYNAGYTGTRSAVTNVEAGHVWNGHETLTHVTTFYTGPEATAPYTPGEFDRHATWAGMLIGGRGNIDGYQRGIAHGAALRSGSIASEWTGASPYRLGFNLTLNNLEAAYGGALAGGSDVINSSYSGSDPGGSGIITGIVDYYAWASRKTIVVSAGNAGPNTNTVGGPASGQNTIAVGALQETSEGNYDTIASFSSRGPNSFFNPATNTTIANARPAVDIVAPGANLVSALYLGATGGNRGGTNDLRTNDYSKGISGTSFSAPIVAGGATLIADVGRDRAVSFGGVTEATDGRVVKAVLLNSADKITGWTNNATVSGGVSTTTQGVDNTSGAGRMNLSKAFDQYTSGTSNLPGLAGGAVSNVGWDYASVAENAPTTYSITGALQANTYLDATLTWFSTQLYNASTDVASYGQFDNLDLQLWSMTESGTLASLVAQSTSLYNEVEHLHFLLPTTGLYSLRVVWAGEIYDYTGGLNSEEFAIAWSAVAVPEPAAVSVLILGAIGLLRRRQQG